MKSRKIKKTQEKDILKGEKVFVNTSLEGVVCKMVRNNIKVESYKVFEYLRVLAFGTYRVKGWEGVAEWVLRDVAVDVQVEDVPVDLLSLSQKMYK